MTNFISLPNEILILVCQNVQLLDLFALRLTSSHISRLILSHSNSIAPGVAQTSFPGAQRLLHVSEGERRDFAWLKSLVNKYLAAILVDRFKLSSERWFSKPLYIPTESEIGDELRKSVENGVAVLKRLSDISKEVYALPDKKLKSASASKYIEVKLRTVLRQHWIGKGIPILIICREGLVLKQRLRYLRSLDESDMEDFRLATMLLSAAFKTKQDQPLSPPWNRKQYIVIKDSSSWVTWAVLHEGPILYFRQWMHLTSVPATCSVFNNSLLESIERYSHKEQAWQRYSVRRLQEVVEGWSMLGMRMEGYLENEMCKYVAWEGGLERFHSGESVPPSWTDDVPYFVNFSAEDGQGTPERGE